MQVSYKNEMQLIFLQYITSLLDTNWIQRRDDVPNLPSLSDFILRERFRPLSLFRNIVEMRCSFSLCCMVLKNVSSVNLLCYVVNRERIQYNTNKFMERVIVMNFLTFGDEKKQSLLFIHGMASSAMLCYEPVLKYLKDYYVILAEVDGHSPAAGELESLAKCCDEIEKYVKENLDGRLYCLSGFSMGATMAVELIGRRNIEVNKLHLDAAFLIKMGVLTKPYTFIFCKAIGRLNRGKRIPKFLMDSVMGKDNKSVVEMLYKDITSKTIKNACEFVYKYDIPDKIRDFEGSVLFWRGANEKYPEKSAALLRQYIPTLRDIVFENMGHGQYLHENSAEYAKGLIEYLAD